MEPQSARFATDVASPKLGGHNYKRVRRTEDSSPYPIPGLASDILHMRVKEGSKIRNLLQLATARMQGDRKGTCGTSPRQVVFSGSGRGLTKTITCAEILKRKVGGLHQVSKLYYKTLSEVWENAQGESNMTVQRKVAAICILLSKDPLDPREPGYQPPQTVSVPAEDTETQRVLVRPDLSPSSQHTSKKVCLGELSVCSSWMFKVGYYCKYLERNWTDYFITRVLQDQVWIQYM